jgi:hypothetical protein
MAEASVNPVEIQKSLKDIIYPAGKHQLVEHAKSHGADQDVLSILEQLPDQQCRNAADVSKSGGQVE